MDPFRETDGGGFEAVELGGVLSGRRVRMRGPQSRRDAKVKGETRRRRGVEPNCC